MKIIITKPSELHFFEKRLGDAHVLLPVETLKINADLRKDSYPLLDYSLIFSCPHSVKSFFLSGFRPSEDFQDKFFNRIYAIGGNTKTELRKHGFGTFKVFETEAELAVFITKNATKERFVHFCEKGAPDVLKKSLPLQNIKYRRETLYKTMLLFPKVQEHFDALVFFDPLEVESFVRHNLVYGKLLFCMDETTQKYLQRFTYTPAFCPHTEDVAGLASLVSSKLN